MTKPPVDHQMCVHLFGATLSPIFANYALRKAVDDKTERYVEAAYILHCNLYVDDLLKSFSGRQYVSGRWISFDEVSLKQSRNTLKHPLSRTFKVINQP